MSGTSSDKLSEAECELIGYIVGIASVFRLPKSVGEIFGLLYISKEPLSMDMIMQKLSVSLGTASQGIKTLRSFSAVRSVYIPGERKEYFQAETDFRKLLNRLVLDEWKPKLETATEQLASIERKVNLSEEDDQQYLMERLKTLRRLNHRANLLFKPLTKIIKS